MAFDQAHANAILDASFDRAGASVRLSTGPMHCRLITSAGSATVNGTELATSGGYTAGTGAPTFTTAAASGGSEASSSAVTVTNMPAGTIPAIEVWDSTPARKQFGNLASPKTTNSGDTFSIAAGAFTSALA